MIISNDTTQTKQRLKLDEYNHVEKPFMKQLEDLGWKTLYLDLHHQQPQQSQRDSFAEVIIRPELVKSLKKVNPFLTDSQVDEVIRKLSSYPNQSLLECNQHVLNLLLENTTVSRNEETGERSPTVRFIDFENLKNNSFLAVSQFKLRIPGTENHIVPDITLFVNGMPLVVVECKSPRVKEPIADAIDQIMRYSEQRQCLTEGNQEFFFYNQFIIATCRNQAKFGTITTYIEKHFYRWTDPYPRTVEDLDHESSSPNDQQRLVAGMLDCENFLELIQSFTIFNTTEEGDTIKVVARYQQYRAVKKCVDRLLSGTNRLERSGIIWHTQGSGKSLTMMFLVRYMKQFLELASWKIVFVTDRTQLQDQLNTTSQTIGYTVKLAGSISKLKELLVLQTPDLVMAMVQKFQERDLDAIFPELNTSPNMLCNMETEQECIDRRLFGDKAKRLDLLEGIKPGDIGFLLNVERDELIGVFRASSEARLHIEADAWKGRFAAQVRVELAGEIKRVGDATYTLTKAGVGMGQLASGMPAPTYPVHGLEVANKLLGQFGLGESTA